MKKVLIFGANGMAGHMITLYLESLNKYDIIPVCYSEKLSRKSLLLDISNLEEVRSILQENKPDIIINCIGILNDKSDDNIPYTVYVNSFFPKFLEHYYHDTKTKIIHLSTDCVFRGIRGSYNEMDFKDEDSIYGLSKNFGEIDNDKDLTIRTSIIGPELKDGKGLFNWFMKSTGVIAGYTNVFWTGVTTLELAHIIDYALDKDVKGLYNVVPNSKISKYDLLNIIKNTFSKDDIEITEEGETKCDKSLVTIKGDFAYKVKSYEEMILELRDWMLTNIVFYPEYFNSKEKVIIIWSKIKAAGFEDSSKAKEWIEHRIKVFMKYTANSFKMQTNQNFIYFINYDDEAETYLLSELKKYPKLPDNIVFTKHYHQDIKEIIPYYKYLYFVRIDSDDMYEKNFIQKLIDFSPKKETQALICQSGYIYESSNNMLAKWFYKSPPFYTLIYKTRDFYMGLRHDVHGHSSVINLPHELIEGDNFVVIVHGENTVTKFNSSFRREVIEEPLEKQKLLDYYDLKELD